MDKRELICIICPTSCKIKSTFDENDNLKDVSGFRCKRGENYVREEIVDPKRTLTAIIKVIGGEITMCPVKTNFRVSKELLPDMIHNVSKLVIYAPVRMGDVIVKNIMGTGADIIATREILNTSLDVS
ncbi:MAG: DUF1667 domain-containing protein [Oligoflexia bacterium]|nr:DUF1667 domain-containing protein [Oligoflexia bacterium]